MPLSIIELNDSEIRVAAGTDIVLRTPGYAVLKPDSIILGAEAMQLSHLSPRETSNRFWANLNQDALAIRSNLARHNADLAYRQLLEIHEQAGKPDEFVFAVPGSYSDEQLSLLLGIVEACPFNAAGLVDIAVAGAAAMAGRGDYVHIDIHLHQTVLTFLSVGDRVTRDRVQVIDDCGITDIYDACAAVIADLFIQQSRFDPLHHAETEQSLYDQIPGCLSALNDRNEVSLEVRYEQSRHQVRLSRDSLLQALGRHYGRILDAAGGYQAVLIGDRLGTLPGFRDRFQEAQLLAADSVFHGITLNNTELQNTPGPHLSFVTSLSASRNPSITPAPDTPAAGENKNAPAGDVTHLLFDHRAVPLGHTPVYLSANGRIDRTRHDNSHCTITRSDNGVIVEQAGELGLYINGHHINGHASVAPGDTLGFAGSDTTYRFIHVTPD